MKNIFKVGIKIVILILIVLWMGIVIMDYFKAKGGNNPNFCVSEEIHVYNEGGNLIKTYKMKEFDALSESEKSSMSYTYQCVGLGYKFYRYNREFKAIEFGPFFIKERLSVDK